MSETYERLRAACAGEGPDAGIAVEAEYAPMGRGGKVMPPTYPGDGRRATYIFEERLIDGQPKKVVLLDSVPSEANRVEQELDRLAPSAELPRLVIAVTVGTPPESAEITSWTAPHRHADAYFEHSLVDTTPFPETEEGRVILAATPEAAAPLFRWFPGSLIFGSWTARKKGRQSRFPRIYVSEVIGHQPIEGERRAGRMDPLNLQKPPTDGPSGARRLSEVGLGNIAPVEQHGGVTIQRATRTAWLSFAGLRRLAFGGTTDADAAARAALAALALWGDRLAFGGPSLWLRSGCELIRTSETVQWIGAAGKRESMDLGVDHAAKLFEEARTAADASGVSMAHGEMKLLPATDLRRAIEYTLLRAEASDEA